MLGGFCLFVKCLLHWIVELAESDASTLRTKLYLVKSARQCDLLTTKFSRRDYHLFGATVHGQAGLHFQSYEEIECWMDRWVA